MFKKLERKGINNDVTKGFEKQETKVKSWEWQECIKLRAEMNGRDTKNVLRIKKSMSWLL